MVKYTAVPIRAHQVSALCEKCGEGTYKSDGNIVLTSNPPLYPHVCKICGDKQNFRETYPTVRYTQEGEKLDLTEVYD